MTSADGRRASVLVRPSSDCAVGSFTRSIRLAADGSFRSQGTAQDRGSRAVVTIRYTLTGRLGGRSGSGSLSTRMTFDPRRGATKRCSGGTVSWQVRDPVSRGGSARPSQGLYFGRAGDQPVILRVIEGGRRIRGFWFRYMLRCPRGSFAESNIAPTFAVRPGGRFRYVEHYTLRAPDTALRYTITMTGQFTNSGTVRGKVGVRSVLRERRGRQRVIGGCRSPLRSFVAAR